MTNRHIDQAREWAESRASGNYLLSEGTKEAVKVIKSLPDHWIDAKELQEIYDSYRANELTLHEAFRAAVALTTPPLQNLAELVEQGNDPQSYQWTQAQVFPTATTLGAITSVDGYTRSAIILFTDGTAKNVPWAFITPLPHLPKLEWPGDSVVDAEIVEGDEPTLPRPEDVPAEEPWIVDFGDDRWVGTREESCRAGSPWALARFDGANYSMANDVDVTLVSRLVPEGTP